MKKKSVYYFCVIMAGICFSMTTSLPCMAENSSGTVEYTIPDSAVLDTGDADSVRQMINELENLREECLAAISAEENVEENLPGEESLSKLDELREGEWITLDRAVCVRVPSEEGGQSYIYVFLSKETDASVVCSTDMFTNLEETEIHEACWYLSDGQLLGYQTGIKDDRINFAGILPQWKEEHRGETRPLFGNGYISEETRVADYTYMSDVGKYYQERAVSIVNPEEPGPLKSVDIRLEEMADEIDLEDASSVASYIRELDRMMSIMSKEKRESSAEMDLKERIVDLPSYVGENAWAWKTGDGRGGVIRGYGGDSYSTYFILDRELLGVQNGNSAGQITFASQLPRWKDDDTTMDVSLVGDEPVREYLQATISRENVMQRYADIIEEIWPDRS